jgi:hypothetical protein
MYTFYQQKESSASPPIPVTTIPKSSSLLPSIVDATNQLKPTTRKLYLKEYQISHRFHATLRRQKNRLLEKIAAEPTHRFLSK